MHNILSPKNPYSLPTLEYNIKRSTVPQWYICKVWVLGNHAYHRIVTDYFFTVINTWFPACVLALASAQISLQNIEVKIKSSSVTAIMVEFLISHKTKGKQERNYWCIVLNVLIRSVTLNMCWGCETQPSTKCSCQTHGAGVEMEAVETRLRWKHLKVCTIN